MSDRPAMWPDPGWDVPAPPWAPPRPRGWYDERARDIRAVIDAAEAAVAGAVIVVETPER